MALTTGPVWLWPVVQVNLRTPGKFTQSFIQCASVSVQILSLKNNERSSKATCTLQIPQRSMSTTIQPISNCTHHFSCSCTVILQILFDKSGMWTSCFYSYCTSQTAAGILLRFHSKNSGCSKFSKNLCELGINQTGTSNPTYLS